MRPRADTTRAVRRFTSRACAWWRTRARTSTPRFTGSPTARTSPRCRSTGSRTFRASSSTPPAPAARIDQDLFAGRDLTGRAVLIRTGWDAHWRTPRYAEGHPHLTRAAAEHLAGAGPALVGIDSLNIDDTADGVRPAHTLLLSAGIPIVEHLCNLAELPESGFRLHCVPAPFRGLGSFPVRAYAVVP